MIWSADRLNWRHLHKVKIGNILHLPSLYSHHCATLEDTFLLKAVRASSLLNMQFFSKKKPKTKTQQQQSNQQKIAQRVIERKIKNVHDLNTEGEYIIQADGEVEDRIIRAANWRCRLFWVHYCSAKSQLPSLGWCKPYLSIFIVSLPYHVA